MPIISKIPEEEKKKYLIITKDCWVIRTTAKAKEFSWNKDNYSKDFIYEGDNYRIFDYNKRSVVPIVKKLMEDFDSWRDVFVLIILCVCLVAWIVTWINFVKIWKVEKQAQMLNSTVLAIWGTVNTVNQKTEEIKNEKEKTVIGRVKDKIENKEEEEETEENKKEKKTEIENKVIMLEQNNRALELEKEKMRLLASQVEPDRLAIYNNIKAEFYEVEKERIKKEVELEYIQWEKKILLEEEKTKIRDQVKKELMELYHYQCEKELEEKEIQKLQEAFVKKYKKILDNCKK